MTTGETLNQVLKELERQNGLWGKQDHPDTEWPETAATLHGFESDVYYTKGRVEEDAANGRTSWFAILRKQVCEARLEAARGDSQALRTELIQMAALISQWVAAIDRRS